MRFARIVLETADPRALGDFYSGLLGLAADIDTEGTVFVQAGATQLVFRPATVPDSFYHFAFNVAPGRFEACYAWMRDRVKIIPVGSGGDIAMYPRWDAMSFYFFDPAGNIAECIVRHTLPDRRSGPFFPSKDFLEVSEIGLPATSVNSGIAEVEAYGIPRYARGPEMDVFQPMGDDDRSLILVVEEGRPWIPTDKGAVRHPFQVHLADGRILNFNR